MPLACLLQWAQSYTVKSPLQHWNASESLDLHILITSIWWGSIQRFKWTENLSRNLLKNTQKESKNMQLFSFHSSATGAAIASGVWELTVNWHSLHVRGAKDTWAASDCCSTFYWCHTLVLKKCPYIKSVFTQMKYFVIIFLCLRHWHLFWKTEFFQLSMAPLKHNIPCSLASGTESFGNTLNSYFKVSQSWSSLEVAACVHIPARSTHTPVCTHPVFILFRGRKKATTCIRPFVPLAEPLNVKGLYTRRKRGHIMKAHINKHTLKNLFSW